MCQWQMAHISTGQVSATQVNALTLALLFVAPIYRPSAAFVSSKQPLNIGTLQFNIFEGIDTFLEVWREGKSFSEIHLPFGIDLRFSAPCLALRFPIPVPGIPVLRIWTLLC